MSRELEIEYSSVFEYSPDLYLLLSPDFTILNASITYLKSTLVKKEDTIGRHLFDVFPNNPSDPNANGVEKLRYSLNKVLAEKKPHKMEIQKYDIANKLGEFQVRYWSPLNTPVVNNLNKLYTLYIE